MSKDQLAVPPRFSLRLVWSFVDSLVFMTVMPPSRL